MRNIKIQKNNKSGVTGVHFNSAKNAWIARITINKKRTEKQFKTREDAIAMRRKWEEELLL